MDEVSSLILARSIERLCMVGVGLASIWMGYKLFTSVYVSDQRAEFKWKDLAVQFHKVVPGSFFVLFGSAILVSSYSNGLSIEDIRTFAKDGAVESNNRSIKYAESADYPALNSSIVAINWAIELAQAKEGTDISDHRENIQNGLDYYKFTRDQLLSERFGKNAYDAWKLYQPQINTAPQSIPADMVESVKDVDAAARDLNY